MAEICHHISGTEKEDSLNKFEVKELYHYKFSFSCYFKQRLSGNIKIRIDLLIFDIISPLVASVRGSKHR